MEDDNSHAVADQGPNSTVIITLFAQVHLTSVERLMNSPIPSYLIILWTRISTKRHLTKKTVGARGMWPQLEGAG